MPVLDLGGVPTHHEVWGPTDTEPVVLLHGGFASLEFMRPLGDLLAEHHRVHAPERPGHGRTPDVAGPYSFEAMVEHTLAYLEALHLGRVHVVGFSDGAIIGLLMARDHSHRVATLTAISANLDPSGFDTDAPDVPDPVVQHHHALLDEEYARLSPDGPDHADEVLRKLFALWEVAPSIDPASLATITAPTLVLAGDRDVVRREHTELIAASVPGARLVVLDDVGHLATRIVPERISAEVVQLTR